MSEFTLNQRWAATIIGTLVARGVRHAVIAPGSRSTPLALAFADRSDVKCWSVIDERSAAFFALGLAKGSTTPVAVVCTSGTAGAHFLPAVMEAREGSTPLVLLTADRPWELHGFGAPQTIDQSTIFSRYVKGTELLPTPDELGLIHLAALTSRLVANALSSPRGPVHFNVPFREPLAPTNPAGPVIDPLTTWFPTPLARIESSELVAAVSRARTGLILCGPRAVDGADLHALGEKLGFPVLAEAASNARFGFAGSIAHYDALLRNERFAIDAAPDLILRFGGGLTAKRPQQWLDECGATVVQVGDHQFDPQHIATWSVPVLPSLQAPTDASVIESRKRYRQKWTSANAAISTQLRAALTAIDEPAIAATLVSALPAGASLVLSSSMPIRDVDAFATSDHRLNVFANRGVNGIDGITSTALGISAAKGTPTALLIGDVALLHDLTGWLIARRHGLNLTVVVVNNDGGGIFHFLPIAERSPHFEQLFGTPHGIDLSNVASLSGATFHRPTSLADFSATTRAALRGGLHLIELKTSRKDNVDVHRSLFAKLAEAVP